MLDTSKVYKAADPNDLTLDDLFVIKASTKIDVLDPPTEGHRMGALLWWSARQAGEPIPWSEISGARMMVIADMVDVADLDLDEDGEVDVEPVPEVTGDATPPQESDPEDSTTS